MNRQRSSALPHRAKTILATLLAGGLLAGCDFPGQRLLHLEVYQTDQLMLRTTFAAPDRERPADFWRRAGAEPFASDEQVARVKPDDGNPLRATLTGLVRIKILHLDRLMTSVSLTNVVLLRSTPASFRWYLAPEEVQRAKRVAGL